MMTIKMMTPMLPTPCWCQWGAVELTLQSCGADWRHDHYKCLSVTDSSLGAIILGDCNLLGKPGVTNQPWSFVLAVPCKRQCALCKRPAMSSVLSPSEDQTGDVTSVPVFSSVSTMWAVTSLLYLHSVSVKSVYSVEMFMSNIADGGGTVMTTFEDDSGSQAAILLHVIFIFIVYFSCQILA